MEYKPLIIKIPVTYILSENQRLGGGRRKHLSPQAVQYKEELSSALNVLGSETFYNEYPWLLGNDNIKATYHFVVNQSMFRRDVDNMIKMMQDSLFEWLELNDSLITEVHAFKFYAPSSETELVVIRLEPSMLNTYAYEEKLRQSSD